MPNGLLDRRLGRATGPGVPPALPARRAPPGKSAVIAGPNWGADSADGRAGDLRLEPPTGHPPSSAGLRPRDAHGSPAVLRRCLLRRSGCNRYEQGPSTRRRLFQLEEADGVVVGVGEPGGE